MPVGGELIVIGNVLVALLENRVVRYVEFVVGYRGEAYCMLIVSTIPAGSRVQATMTGLNPNTEEDTEYEVGECSRTVVETPFMVADTVDIIRFDCVKFINTLLPLCNTVSARVGLSVRENE